MKILYLVADGDHGHCYGTDNLLAGFIGACGFENVFDWPEKDNVHLPDIAARDGCQISSDQCWPRKGHRIQDVAPTCDLAILTAYDPRLFNACSFIPTSVPIVAVDFGDALGDFRQRYENVCRRRVALYGKRELPFGASFATPMPLSFPLSRVPDPLPPKLNRVQYWATSHGGGDPGQPRLRITRELAYLLHLKVQASQDGLDLDVQGRRADIRLTRGQAKGTRPSPEVYYASLAQSLVGIHFNCAENWDANRFHENFAFGLAQVAEWPRIQILHQPEPDRHCVYVRTPDDVAPAVVDLLQDEERARRIAAAGHAHWREYLSSEAQAQRIIDLVGKKGG